MPTERKTPGHKLLKSVIEGELESTGLERVNLVLSELRCQWWGFCEFSFEENIEGCLSPNQTSVMVLSKRKSKAVSSKELKRVKIGGRQRDQYHSSQER